MWFGGPILKGYAHLINVKLGNIYSAYVRQI